jgi:hypothetical protein
MFTEILPRQHFASGPDDVSKFEKRRPKIFTTLPCKTRIPGRRTEYVPSAQAFDRRINELAYLKTI